MSIPESPNKKDDQKKSSKREGEHRFVWKRVYGRLLLYLIAILVIMFIFSKPAVTSLLFSLWH